MKFASGLAVLFAAGAASAAPTVVFTDPAPGSSIAAGTVVTPRGSWNGVDMVVIVDESGSVDATEQVSTVSAMTRLNNQLSAGVRLGVVKFSSYARTTLTMTSDANARQNALGTRTFPGGSTAIAAALALARGELNGERARPGAERVIVLVTEGQCTCPSADLTQQAQANDQAGIVTYVLDYGTTQTSVGSVIAGRQTQFKGGATQLGGFADAIGTQLAAVTSGASVTLPSGTSAPYLYDVPALETMFTLPAFKLLSGNNVFTVVHPRLRGNVTTSLTLVGTDVAPEITLPTLARGFAVEDTARTFAVAEAIRVADANDNALTMTLTLAAGTGSVSVDETTVTKTSSGPNTVTYTGNVAGLNDALKTMKFEPLPNFNGSVSLTIDLSDGVTTPVTSTLAFDVTEVNDAPVATADTLATKRDVAVAVPAAQLLANDTLGAGPLDVGTVPERAQTWKLVAVGPTSAKGGTVIVDGETVRYTPPRGFTGADTFTYRVADDGTTAGAADPLEATGTVTVDVTELPSEHDAGSSIDHDAGDDASAELASGTDAAEGCSCDAVGRARSSGPGAALLALLATSLAVRARRRSRAPDRVEASTRT